MANPYQSKIDAYRNAALAKQDEEKQKEKTFQNPFKALSNWIVEKATAAGNDLAKRYQQAYGLSDDQMKEVNTAVLSAFEKGKTMNDVLAEYGQPSIGEQMKNAISPSSKSAQATVNPVASTTATTNTANPAPTVETEYQKQQDLMAMEQQAANRNAVTAYQRAMKYLPQMQKEQGLYGLGVSESGQIAAQNDLMSRLAQTDLYYDQLLEQQNAEKSSQYLQMAASQMENATSLDEIKSIADRYKPYLSDGDKNTLDLYISQVESPAYQEQVQQSKVDALWDTARSGGYTFKHNWAGGADKWAKGGQFVIEEANGKNRNVEIAEVNPSGDDVLIGLANKAHDQDLFFYNGDLYMVYDHDTDSGEKKRELYRLAFKSGTGKTNMLKAYQAQA